MCCIFGGVGGFPLLAPGRVLLQELMHKPLPPHFHDGRAPAHTSEEKTPQSTGKPPDHGAQQGAAATEGLSSTGRGSAACDPAQPRLWAGAVTAGALC